MYFINNNMDKKAIAGLGIFIIILIIGGIVGGGYYIYQGGEVPFFKQEFLPHTSGCQFVGNNQTPEDYIPIFFQIMYLIVHLMNVL